MTTPEVLGRDPAPIRTGRVTPKAKPAAGSFVDRTRLVGDEYDRYQRLADGTILQGDGTTPPAEVVNASAAALGAEAVARAAAIAGLSATYVQNAIYGDVAAILAAPILADIALASPLLDHTAALQAQIDACPDFSRLLLPKGNWRFTNILSTKSIVLDFGGSSLVVDPTPVGVTTGNPAIWFKGALGAARAFTAMTVLSSSITLTTPGHAADFALGDYVLVKDSLRVDAWDDLNHDGVSDAGSSANSFGYTGRAEVRRVESASTGTGVVTFEAATEWAYATAPTITRMTPLIEPAVLNIGSIMEVDPGGIYASADIQLAPHLIKFDHCLRPRASNITASRFNLMVLNFENCVEPFAYDVAASDPYRPENGGHGYLLRFYRCNNGLAQRTFGDGVRHVVDHCQAYGCWSERGVAVNPANTAFAQHGLGEKRCGSLNDSVYGRSDAYSTGWNAGNPAFSASYDAHIVHPTFVGAGAAIVVGFDSVRTMITDPAITATADAASPLRGVFVCSGAAGTKVSGGYIDMSQSTGLTSNAILARNSLNLADTFSHPPIDLDVANIEIVPVKGDGATAVSTVSVVNLTAFSIRRCRLPGVNSLSYTVWVTAALASLIVEDNEFSGPHRYGIRVDTAPTTVYRVVGNKGARATFAAAYLTLAASAALVRFANSETVVSLQTDMALVPGTNVQAFDVDLAAIAALTTTAFGRTFLDLADAAAGRTKLALGTAAMAANGDFDAAGAAAAAQAAALAASQPLDSDLTAIAALTTTSYGRAFLALADAAAARSAIGAAAAPLHVPKAVDQTINNNAGFTDDTELVLAVAANTVYELSGEIAYEGTTTADVRMTFTGPTAATMALWTIGGPAASTTSFTNTGLLAVPGALGVSQIVGGAGAGTIGVARPLGRLVVGANAGNFQFKFGQATAEVSDVIIKAGSWLTLRKVA